MRPGRRRARPWRRSSRWRQRDVHPRASAERPAFNVAADELPWGSIAKALGLTEKEARSHVMRYGHRI